MRAVIRTIALAGRTVPLQPDGDDVLSVSRTGEKDDFATVGDAGSQIAATDAPGPIGDQRRLNEEKDGT